MKFKSTPVAAAAAALALVGAGSAGAFTLPSWLHKNDDKTSVAATSAPTVAPNVAIEPIPAGSAPNFRAIIKAEGPAVVGVTVSGLHQADQGDEGPAFDDDPFFRFFRGLPGFQNMPHGAMPFRGQGSGFIISPDGVILTNAHVVRDAKQVTVKLSDRREFSAKVLGSDTATDIAVLKIDATGLPVVKLGDSKAAQVGDYVLAIGAPFGFEQSATQGIVSAKGRSLPGDSYVPFIQTDAAVNPGNSGGPLFDAAGRVIGINAQIYSRNGGFQGLAFAIPIDVALHVKDEVIAHGHVDHARLGVTLQDLSAPLADSFGMKAPDGALVASVTKGSAAASAGLKAGDVITAIDGKPVSTAGDVSTFVGNAQPGDRVALSIWRDKSSREMSVSLGKADDETPTTMAKGQSGSLGLAVRPLQREELRESGLDHGLLIEGSSGPAALAGVQAGDVLLALNGKPVNSVEQVREAMHKKPRHVALLISRDGQQIFVPVNLG
jgi:serine protease Do